MKRVLIVSPRFPPSNAPDMHRVRLALPWLKEGGWCATVLAVKPEFVPVTQDSLLTESIPSDIPIIRTAAWSRKLTRRLGVGSLTLRARGCLDRAARRLFSEQKFDLVYFSTTEFGLFSLGPRWKAMAQVPYVLDYQDPWITTYYRDNGLPPPGGGLKYAVVQRIARRLEPSIVAQASHITAVSPVYIRQLIQRHGYPEQQTTVLPFAGSEADFELLRSASVPNPLFDSSDGLQHWLYAGVAGPYMNYSVTAILTAFKSELAVSPRLFGRVRLHFAGTNYVQGRETQPQILPIAAQLGLEKFVSERTGRLPYFQTLKCLLDADALIVPGSDDPAYTASKIYPYILARKPLLAVFHERSPVCRIVRECRSGVVVGFDSATSVEATARTIQEEWFCNGACRRIPRTDWAAFYPCTSQSMTERLCKAFDQASD